MKKVVEQVLTAVLMIAVAIFLAAIIWGFPTMWLWNWLMPKLFGVPTVNFWEAFGLSLLAGILLKSNVNIKKH